MNLEKLLCSAFTIGWPNIILVLLYIHTVRKKCFLFCSFIVSQLEEFLFLIRWKEMVETVFLENHN